MIVDLSRCNLLLGVSFHKGEHTGVVYCDYAGLIESGDTAQEAFDAALIYHTRLCEEEEAYKLNKEETK
tara:strand:- start:252 stop:458 length:207 start_codon:yes stop_codon:yes gene_type:complete